MIRSLGIPLAAGLLSAVLFLSLAKGLAAGMLLSYLAPLPLLAVGLSRGAMAATVAGVAAMAAVGLVGNGFSALSFALTAALPGLVISRQALLWRKDADGNVQWYPPGLVLAWLVGLGMALIVIGALLIPGQTEAGEAIGIESWIRVAIDHTLRQVAPDLPAEQQTTLVDGWTSLFPALVGGSWVMMAVVNAACAQGILVRLGRNLRPSPAYGTLELPIWLAVVLVAALLVGSVAGGDPGYLARSLAALGLLPFILVGLATVHGWAAKRPNAKLVLGLTYGVLFLASIWVMIPLAGLGMAKFMTRFRRLADSDGGKEK